MNLRALLKKYHFMEKFRNVSTLLPNGRWCNRTYGKYCVVWYFDTDEPMFDVEL